MNSKTFNMGKYISKDAVVAEIKTRIETYNKGYANGDGCRADALETLLHDIDFLEVKEVNLEKEIDIWYDKFATNNRFDWNGFAKHFFELGLKAKGE